MGGNSSASSVTVSHSQNEAGHAMPLSDALRARLEDSFEADLASIRITWMTELSQLGLAGTACGDLIMLDPSVIDLDSSDGIADLAHEIAHSLQQRSWKCAQEAGSDALRILDPKLEEAADWAASVVRRSGRVPRAVREVATDWTPGARTRLSRCDCLISNTMKHRGLTFPALHLQGRVAGGTTYYGGDIPTCPICASPTITTHELSSNDFLEFYCGALLTNLHDLRGKTETERVVGGKSKGYMVGVLWATTGEIYGACSGTADSIPEAFDTAIAMTTMLGCRDNLDLNNLRTRGRSVINRGLIYKAPRGYAPGNCAAQKLIQQCYSDGRTPLHMVEMFYGSNSPTNGMVIESCDTCKNLLPPMLCPH